MTMDSKICSLRFHLRRSKKEEEEEEEEDLVDLDISREKVDLLSRLVIDRVFHCDGLLLCICIYGSKFLVWNPYLAQTRWIVPRTDTCFHRRDNYALGYDMNRNHKILRFLDFYCSRERKHLFVSEIYDLPSDSWRVLEVMRPDWELELGHRGVSLKGNNYFWAREKKLVGEHENFLVCFDFTRERFGQPLHLPFHSCSERTVTLSSVRDEKLALLRQIDSGEEGETITIETLEIWITTKVDPNDVTWSKFMNVDMRPLIGDREEVFFDEVNGSFFIDEEEKVAVVFELDDLDFRDERIKTPHYHTAFIIGDEGYYKTVSLGVAPDLSSYSPTRVCSSSYLPSLVQLNQPSKRKEGDDGY